LTIATTAAFDDTGRYDIHLLIPPIPEKVDEQMMGCFQAHQARLWWKTKLLAGVFQFQQPVGRMRHTKMFQDGAIVVEQSHIMFLFTPINTDVDTHHLTSCPGDWRGISGPDYRAPVTALKAQHA